MTNLETKKALLADELSTAEDAVRRAVEHYQDVAARSDILDATDLGYTPSTAMLDMKDYRLDSVGALRPFRNDSVLHSAAGAENPLVELLLLEASPRWQDRIRAKALQLALANDVTLPDGFPCIYEPRDDRRSSARNYVWVASPDEGMLHELLPLYRELWASYESQWPNSPNREFVVGRLDGVSPYKVFRPGATPADVIARTMLTHDGMYARAPEHLKQMHPRHKDWTRSRLTAREEFTP